MNIAITRSLAETILRLKQNKRINRIRRRRTTYHLWAPDGGGAVVRISDEMVTRLLKLKFIEKRTVNTREQYWNYTTHTYYATDLCKQFNLPPEEFWMPDGPV